VVKTSPKGLIPCGQIYNNQIIIRDTILKFLIISLLSKKENRDKLVLQNQQNIHLLDHSLSNNYIKITQKQTKKEKSIHKLHSLHSVT